jgi:biopolymer transport protein ExbD
MARYKRELRREIKRKQIEPEINFLNITAMLDMMTIILVFLLKTMASSTASMPQNDQLKLPISALADDPDSEPGGMAVLISKAELIVGDDAQSVTIARLPGDAATLGFSADVKDKQDRNSLLILPLQQRATDWAQRDYKARSASDPSAAASSPNSEARIIADASTSFRVLLEVMNTLGVSHFSKMHLMVMQGKK